MKRKAMAAVAAGAGILALAFGCTTPLPTGVGVAPPPVAVAAGPAGSPVSFATQVKPTVTTRCVECHAGINTFAGATGSGRVKAGDSAASPLFTKAAAGMGSPTDVEKGLIKDWIDQGAKDN